MVAGPVEEHANGFGADLFDSMIDNATGGRIVGGNGGGRLGVPHFYESGADDSAFLGLEEERAAVSASAAEDTTPLMTLEMLTMGPLRMMGLPGRLPM